MGVRRLVKSPCPCCAQTLKPGAIDGTLYQTGKSFWENLMISLSSGNVVGGFTPLTTGERLTAALHSAPPFGEATQFSKAYTASGYLVLGLAAIVSSTPERVTVVPPFLGAGKGKTPISRLGLIFLKPGT